VAGRIKTDVRAFDLEDLLHILPGFRKWL
jgi:hypothetical protein